MSLHAEMTEEEFTEEMTHRVVKYGARSPESREALRFSKRHPNSRLQKIARFKISEQERFDIEHGLASPWVKVLHFLDEEVFDRLRLGSIGQIVAVTTMVLSILFLSDRSRAWFGGTPSQPTGVHDNELLLRAMDSPSPADEWLNKKLIEAINSKPVHEALSRTMQTAPDAELATHWITALQSAIQKDGSLKLSLSEESNDELQARLRATVSGDRLSVEHKSKAQAWLDNPDDRAVLMELMRAELQGEAVQTRLRGSLAEWLGSPLAKTAIESAKAAMKEAVPDSKADQ